MPELLAGDIGWLGAGWLFAWVIGALARLIVCAAPRAARGGRVATTPRCGRRGRGPVRPMRAARARAFARAFWFVVPLALLVAGAAYGAHAAHALAVTAAGALCGEWLALRRVRPLQPRVVAIAGCAVGAAAVAGGFALHLLLPRYGVLERGALYVAVSLGAWMLAASASAWCVDAASNDGAREARRNPARFACVPSSGFGDWTTYGLAIALCAALAYGFVAADSSSGFRLAALIAASGLTSALGARMMAGARFAVAGRPHAKGPHATVARAHTRSAARISLAGIPDELLVAACVEETFDADCLLPFDASDTRRGAWLAALPRRRPRGRMGAHET